jgi:hypothetical protein
MIPKEMYFDGVLPLLAIAIFVISVSSGGARRRIAGSIKLVSWIDSPRLKWMDHISSKISDEHLIQFDRPALIIIGVSGLACLLCCSLKLHGLSTAMWDSFIAGRTPSTGLIAGEPKEIRMDDYAVTVPNVFSQVYSKEAFSTRNRSIGGEQTALYWYPANHFIEVPRFLYWGFHFLPVDAAYSIYWNLKNFLVFAGIFVLLMLLTGRSLLAGAGALWILYSSPTQWWFLAYLPETIAFGSLTMVAGVYLILTRKRHLLIAASIVFVVTALNFVLILYPPFCIPFAWVMLFAGGGLLWEKRKLLLGPDPIKIRWLALAVCLVLIVGVLCAFLVDTSATLKLITSTVYPGHRVSDGGSTDGVPRLISSLFESVYTEARFPAFLGNICEASSYYLGGLVIVPLIFYHRPGIRKASAVDFAITVCLGGLLVYFLLGVPEILAKATLLSASHINRVKCAIGVATIILLMRYFARFKSSDWPAKPAGLVALILIIGATLVGVILNFLHYAQFRLPTAVVLGLIVVNSVLVFLLATGRAIAFFLLLFALVLPSNILINPVSRGFKAITNKALYKTIATIRREDPDAKWAVFAPIPLVNFVKFCGVDIINGVKNAPVFEYSEMLDSEHRYIQVWNNYAYVLFDDSGSTTISFDNEQAYYVVSLSIASDALTRLGVRYCLLTKPPAPEYTASIVKHVRDGNMEYWILRRDLIPTRR